ncbi:hypothetical protein TNCT_430031 [Trichonephila clavata]|uniref:Uncharacterized protein n=1 Tax=Trichonephila clavata TaxID=2740835 RepID=A0A8X6HJP6_TRICU|nr:hypothetical protein TNCT_430031 [Trichonephila clavata]
MAFFLPLTSTAHLFFPRFLHERNYHPRDALSRFKWGLFPPDSSAPGLDKCAGSMCSCATLSHIERIGTALVADGYLKEHLCSVFIYNSREGIESQVNSGSKIEFFSVEPSIAAPFGQQK